MKLTGSTTVGWTISLPAKMPQVTALGCMSGALVRFRPCTLALASVTGDQTDRCHAPAWNDCTYVNVNNVVVDSRLVLLQNFKESRHIFTGSEELQVRLKNRHDVKALHLQDNLRGYS